MASFQLRDSSSQEISLLDDQGFTSSFTTVSTATSISTSNSQIISQRIPRPACFKMCKGTRGVNAHIRLVHKHLPLLNECPPSSNLSVLPSTYTTGPNHTLKSITNCLQTCMVLKHIPKGARTCVAEELAKTIDSVITLNNTTSWEHLLSFSFNYLHIPPSNKEKKTTLT